MTPQSLLDHTDKGRLWPAAPSDATGYGVAAAYRDALAVRSLRVTRGEIPRGFKVGFTNRNLWQRYNVAAPIWGTVFDTTLAFCENEGTLSLRNTCQPRIEPEAVFGMKATPATAASLEDLFDAIDWVAPGFEIVQSHLPGWKFRAPDTIVDNGLHARLLVGNKRRVRDLADNAAQLDQRLAACTVSLCKGDTVQEDGRGSNVLDSPLRALHHFLIELRQCPGAPDAMPGDVITTGTWTDAWPVAAGERWKAVFGAPLSDLAVDFTV
jgi:2-oxo-3-hexenedioate decarboxylase